jgi:hypothetical protein
MPASSSTEKGTGMKREGFPEVEAAFQRMVNDNGDPRAFLSALLEGRSESAEAALTESLTRKLLKPPTEDAVVQPMATGAAPHDLPFVNSITILTQRGFSAAGSAILPDWSIRDVGQELDFVAECRLPEDLTPVQILNLLLLRHLRPSKDVAAVATIRNEGLYLLEWIAFNRAIGLADIFVYTNDNVDGSDELLQVLAHLGIIRLLRNSIASGTDPQRKAYQHAIHLLHELRAYKWVIFIDADEFLVLDQRYDHNIGNFLAHVETTFSGIQPGAVLFPWDWRLSDLSFKKTDGLLFERYQHSVRHNSIKALTRLKAALGMWGVHVPALAEGDFCVDSGLLPVTDEVIFGLEPKSDAGGAIAHFWGKSFEEFAIKKMTGDGLLLADLFLRQFSDYFQWTSDLNPQNCHPFPSALVERAYKALNELRAFQAVSAAMAHIDTKLAALWEQLERDMSLRSTYDEMRSKFRPMMNPL